MNYIHPNFIAYAALLIWPAVALYLFSRLPVSQAMLWTILGGYLLLPTGLDIKFQMIPAFNKMSIPNFAALLGCAIYARQSPKFFRGFGLPELLILIILFGPFITSILNGDPIRVGATFRPGVGAYDAGSTAIFQFTLLLPFFLGRQFLRSGENSADVLRVMVIAGCAYSLLILVELRMSPQLHNWLYGYFPFDYSVEFRNGGFRSVVFLQNGLLLAFFTTTATMAAAALWRTRTRVFRRVSPAVSTGYLGLILLLCKTLSVVVYGAVAVPLIRWASPRMQLRVACVLVAIALSYPMVRVTDVFPTTSLLQVASAVSTDRASSLETRFLQEDQLLERAWQRPWFGWGRYGRNRVYSGWNGADTSATDGFWIITVGVFGLVGFFGMFGLLALAVVRAASALKFAPSAQEGAWLAALALILAINMIDLLPNASLTPWTLLLAGTLVGRAEALRATSSQKIRFRTTEARAAS
jgi:hypothetical protein